MIKRGKRGQQLMSMPFEIIFSIILIVAFIVVAFIAINHFLSLGKCAGVGQFYEDFQAKINSAYSSQMSDFNYSLSLPSGIEKVCFGNLTDTITNQGDYELLTNYEYYGANVFLIPAEKACDMPYKSIANLDVGKIIVNGNPYCVDASSTIKIKKGFYDKLVSIE